MIWFERINKTQWLCYVYIFDKIAMKKHIIDVKLTYKPALRIRKGRDLNSMTKSFSIFQTILLIKSFGDKTCLVMFKLSISTILGAINPLAHDHIHRGCVWQAEYKRGYDKISYLVFGVKPDMIYLSYPVFSARPDRIKLFHHAFSAREIGYRMG